MTPPIILDLSPENQTYNTTDIPLNFTVDEETSRIPHTVWMEMTASLIVGNSTLTDLSVGAHNLTVCAVDTAGNVGNSTTVQFTVVNPTPSPSTDPFPTASVIAAFVAFVVAVVLTILVYVKWMKR